MPALTARISAFSRAVRLIPLLPAAEMVASPMLTLWLFLMVL